MSNDKITLDDLRRAADAVPAEQPSLSVYLARWSTVNVISSEQERSAREDFATADRAYERARAEFWRLAYRWMSEFIARDTGGQDELDQLRTARAIATEVESRT